MLVSRGRAGPSVYLASAAKLPPVCRQARLLRAFTRVFSGCLFPTKCIRLCDPVFWQSKRKPKNCWHLQQNFVFCVIAITRLRTGNSFKTSSDEFTESLIFPTAKTPYKATFTLIFIMSIYFSHSVSEDSDPVSETWLSSRSSSSHHSHSQRGKYLKHFHQADKTDLMPSYASDTVKSHFQFSVVNLIIISPLDFLSPDTVQLNIQTCIIRYFSCSKLMWMDKS